MLLLAVLIQSALSEILLEVQKENTLNDNLQKMNRLLFKNKNKKIQFWKGNTNLKIKQSLKESVQILLNTN